jgi:hypothetical protein
VIALADLGDCRSDLLDDASGLVPEHDRHGIAQRAVDHFQIGVAETGGAHAHQHVRRAERCGADLLDRQRRAGLVQHRGAIGQAHG